MRHQLPYGFAEVALVEAHHGRIQELRTVPLTCQPCRDSRGFGIGNCKVSLVHSTIGCGERTGGVSRRVADMFTLEEYTGDTHGHRRWLSPVAPANRVRRPAQCQRTSPPRESRSVLALDHEVGPPDRPGKLGLLTCELEPRGKFDRNLHAVGKLESNRALPGTLEGVKHVD